MALSGRFSGLRLGERGTGRLLFRYACIPCSLRG